VRPAATAQRVVGDRTPLLATVATGWLLVLGTRFVVPALLPAVRVEFRVSNATVGGAMTLLWLVYALMQFPAGLLAQRFGERAVLVTSLAVAAVAVLAFATAPGFVGFVLACGLFGLGTGLYFPPVTTLLTGVSRSDGDTALGVMLAAGNLGAALLPLAGTAVAARYGWRLGVGFVLPLLAAAAVGVRAVAPTRSTPASRVGSRDRSLAGVRTFLAAVFGRRRVVLPGAAITLLTFTNQGIATFLPTYLVVAKGLAPESAAALYGLFFAAGAVSQPAAGRIAARFGSRRMLVWLTAFPAAALGTLPFVRGAPWLAVVVLLVGLRVVVTPVNEAYVVASLPPTVRGSGYGLLRTITLVISASGSMVVGALADVGLFDAAFLGLAVLSGVAALTYALLPADEPATAPSRA
jgi:predicted MFS family arabinose efflux permease